jgi:hypothetical protein
MSSLFRDVFAGLARPNAETRMVHNDSFGNLPFVGGEEEAHDYWDRKWEAHRRTSFERAAAEREAVSVVRQTEQNTTKPAGQMKAELMRAELALGGVLPAGKATLAPRAEKQGERRKASPPPPHSGEWF